VSDAEPLDPSTAEAPGEATVASSAGGEGYRRLFESHPMAMAIWDPETGRIVAANDAALHQYGYERSEIVGLAIERIVHPEDLPRLREQLPRLPGGVAVGAVFRHIRRDGRVIEVEMSGHSIEWQGQPARLVIAADVTARRRLEEELRVARTNEAVGRLAGGIAHDFNNLVMAINGFSELLIERLPAEGEEHDAALEIRAAGTRAAALTSQLVAFARPHDPKPERVDVNELVESLTATVRGVAGPLVEVVIVPRAAYAIVVADRTQLGQLIVGCALNARDDMPDGGTLTIETDEVSPLTARALSGVVGDAPFVALTIADTGRSRPTSPWDPRAESSKPIGRAGIGLALVYSSVQQAGGRIRLESTPGGRGSAIRIFLPLASTVMEGRGDPSIPSDEAAPIAPAPDARSWEMPALDASELDADAPAPEAPVSIGISRALRGTTIAVVEDEPAVRSLVERLLRRANHEVITFSDGAAAIDGLADPTIQVDLLVTDLVMPGQNGFEVARRVRGMRPGLPVLLMSGYAADALQGEGLQEDQVEVLGKPFSAQELIDRVDAVLASGHHRAFG
jgi:two-component system cell cycle sensor histidine kinase/response regulator CckA